MTRAATSTPLTPPMMRWQCPACGIGCNSRTREVLWRFRAAHAGFHKSQAIWRHPIEERQRD